MIYEHLHKMIRDSEGLQATEQGARSRLWPVTSNPRIVRVPRSFGGKDRHSKVSTVRGLRDRRVRLSVATAIQVYNLQDKLGLDQPSKVVDWLINAAQHAIDKLPPLIQFPYSLRSSYEEGLILPPSYQALPMMPIIGEVQDQQVADKNSETVHQISYDQYGVSNMHVLSYLGSNSNQEELNQPYCCCQTLPPCSSMPCIFDTKQYNQVHMPFSVAEDLSLGQYNHHESSMPSI